MHRRCYSGNSSVGGDKINYSPLEFLLPFLILYFKIIDSANFLVVTYFTLLKDDPSTNAGRGSNLTEDGHVECDASLMDGDSGAFGAVGAVPGIRLVLLDCYFVLQSM